MILRLREKSPAGPRIPVANRLIQAAVPLALADDLKSGISTAENLMVPKRLALNTSVESPLAAFGLVSGMVFPVIMFPAAVLFGLNELLIPELARCSAAGSERRIHYLVHKSLRVALVFGLTCSGLLFLLSDSLCLSLYDSLDAAKYLRWYSLLVPMLYCDAVTDAMTKGLGQQKVCVRYNILTSGLDVLLLYFLLPKFGMEGYFVSFLVTHVLNFSLSLGRLLKITHESIPFYIPALSVSAMFFSIFASSFLQASALRAAAYLALLASLLFLLKVLNREDVVWVKGLIRKNDLTKR